MSSRKPAFGASTVWPAIRSTASPTPSAPRSNCNGFTCRHEETAAFAAGAEAHLTGTLAVCAGSCGPGNLHLINGLYDCHRSRVPVLAIAAQIPSGEIGSGYFQETHPEHLFAQCSHYCELVSQAEQMPRVLEIAMQTALVAPGRLGGRHPRRRRPARGRRTRAASAFSAAAANRVPVRRRNRDVGHDPQSIEEDHHPGRRRLRGRACRIDCARRQAECADRARDARKRVHRVRQSVRRRDDWPARVFLRLSRDDELPTCC